MSTPLQKCMHNRWMGRQIIQIQGAKRLKRDLIYTHRWPFKDVVTLISGFGYKQATQFPVFVEATWEKIKVFNCVLYKSLDKFTARQKSLSVQHNGSQTQGFSCSIFQSGNKFIKSSKNNWCRLKTCFVFTDQFLTHENKINWKEGPNKTPQIKKKTKFKHFLVLQVSPKKLFRLCWKNGHNLYEQLQRDWTDCREKKN